MLFSKQTVWRSLLGRNYIGNSHIFRRGGSLVPLQWFMLKYCGYVIFSLDRKM